MVGCYIPPSVSPGQFEDILDEISIIVQRRLPEPLIVAGDFNAKNRLWSSRLTDRRGRVLEDWAAVLGLVLINQGSSSTLVRPQGESIIDLTWASPSAADRIDNWRVMSQETLSDHLYIRMRVDVTRRGVLNSRPAGGGDPPPKRWALRQLDTDRLMAAVLSETWPGAETPLEVEGQVEWLGAMMARACDFAMPRVRPRPRRAAYWWTEEIAELRRTSVNARRRFTRERRRGPSESVDEALEGYREARKSLSAAIRKAKAKAWDEQLLTLDSDPWGRPYKIVMNKMRHWAPPVTESLEPEVLEDTLSTLFPVIGRTPEILRREPVEWDEDLEVSSDEMAGVIKRLRARGNKAPGPDGVPGRVWVHALAHLSEPVAEIFSSCLREGYFPPVWERANVVLIPKEGRAAGSPSAYRPICLLDEIGKMLERIIANRLVQHLKCDGPDLHEDQFGFREGRSTTDAIIRVRSLVESDVEEGRVVVAVSLDIKNAFNSLPWGKVRGALQHHGVPQYLVEATKSYFRNRGLEYRNKRGTHCRREMYCGVPQGSVLGPLLWDIAYDRVLRTALPPGCSVVCYADDTLLLAGGADWGEATRTTNLAVACVVRAIKDMGLRVAPSKTEAIFFHSGLRGRPPTAHIQVDGTPVQLGKCLKYLGLQLDGRWSFDDHFDRLAGKVNGVVAALSRLLPNLGGPDDRVRRIYAHTVNSVALYGSPVWVDKAVARKKIRDTLRRVQRRVAIRLVRGYRTVSHAAASVLAGLPPMELVARAQARAYERVRELRGLGVPVTARIRGVVRLQTRRQMMEEWGEYLTTIPPTDSGGRVVGAVGPVLEEWTDRPHGKMSFHLTQVLAGHGCFGQYLRKIRKESTTQCHHCEAEMDTAQHTLEFCPAWAEERRVLSEVVGEDLSLPAIVKEMVGSEEAWRAVATFCARVMTQKEAAERERERAATQGSGSDDDDGEDGDDWGGRRRRRRSRRRPPPCRRNGGSNHRQHDDGG